QPVIAVVGLGGSPRSIEDRCTCAGLDVYWLLQPHERTGRRRDHELLGPWIRLRVFGVLDPEDVARDLDDRVLEATSRAGERHPALPRMADRREYPLHAHIGTARSSHDASISDQALRVAIHLVAWDPLDVRSSQLQAVSHRPMRLIVWPVVSHDCD